MSYVKNGSEDFIDIETAVLYGAVMKVEEELESWKRPLNSSDRYAVRKEKDKNKMLRLFHEIIERDGAEEVAKRIRNSGERFNQLLGCILYGRDDRRDLEREFVEMGVILYGRPLSVAELRKLR